MKEKVKLGNLKLVQDDETPGEEKSPKNETQPVEGQSPETGREENDRYTDAMILARLSSLNNKLEKRVHSLQKFLGTQEISDILRDIRDYNSPQEVLKIYTKSCEELPHLQSEEVLDLFTPITTIICRFLVELDYKIGKGLDFESPEIQKIMEDVEGCDSRQELWRVYFAFRDELLHLKGSKIIGKLLAEKY